MGKEPCGECHIQPGEVCDMCGASYAEPPYEKFRKAWRETCAQEDAERAELEPCHEPGKLRSTNAMRARVRALAKPNECDYDRAVIAILDDLEMKLTGLRRAAADLST